VLLFPDAGTRRKTEQVILKGMDPEEKSSGPGKLEKGKSQKYMWGSGKLHALRTLNDALLIMRITTGCAYLWNLKDQDRSTGEKQSSQYKQEMKMKDLTG
jgi:hypothetical protein